MKNIIIVLRLLVMLAISAAAWAGEGRSFTSQQELKIRNIIQSFYPNGIKIVMEDDDWGNTRIVCWAKYSEDYFLFTASSNGSLKLNEICPGSAFRTGIKMEERIFRVLNPSASEELGRDLIK